MWMFMLALVTLSRSGVSDEAVQKPLHLRMSTAEIQKLFGVDSHHEVPEYDVTEPYQSTAQGDFLSYNLHNKDKTKRNVDYQNDQHYTIRAFGRKLHLNLRENKDLIAPGLKLETYKDGKVVRSEIPRSVHYTGRVSGDPQSTVAITHYEGLLGRIELNDDMFYIRPLPRHLMKGPISKRGGTPHMVYKTTADIANDVMDNSDNRLMNDQEVSIHNYAHPTHRYLEYAVVADEHVFALHGSNKDSTTIYMLVMANMVAATYQDKSIGKHKITLVVNKLFILDDKELAINKTSSMRSKLKALGRWARSNNPLSDTDPGHYDVISLIQRGGGVGGLAGMGTICRRVSANAAGDRGLQTAFILAHEIGHNLGVNHDPPGCTNMVNIMSSTAPGGRGAMRWSKCSKIRIQKILESAKTSCLDDRPQALNGPMHNFPTYLRNKLPGQIFNKDMQCRMAYGPPYFSCRQQEASCSSLYCTTNPSWCGSFLSPPASGSRCGPRHWCIKGECVDDGSPVINGGWSEWSGYSQCSHTCGGGVRYRQRTCTKPSPQSGGEKCEGPSKGRWGICNTNECPAGQPSYRDILCQIRTAFKYNTTFYMQRSPCRLACRSGSRVKVVSMVPDGTRCYADRKVLDVCAERECKAVGCNHVIDSGAQLDRCKKCDGDGSTCRLVKEITGQYKKDYRNAGPDNSDTIAVLPVGAFNIYFQQRKKSWNRIGIQNQNGEYLIKLPSASTTVNYAGSTIKYWRPNIKNEKDKLTIDGPITESLTVKFVYQKGKNRGINYKYSLLANPVTSYEWKTGDWSAECSASCADGIKTRVVKCIRSDDKTPAGDWACPGSKPETKMNCNVKKCPPVWHLTNWTPCSKTCGTGDQSRALLCRQQLSPTHHVTVPQCSCDSASKPNITEDFRLCNVIECPPEWQGLEWSQCSTTCGPGVITRKLQCYWLDESGVETVVADELCQHAVKLVTTESCNMETPCQGSTKDVIE